MRNNLTGCYVVRATRRTQLSEPLDRSGALAVARRVLAVFVACTLIGLFFAIQLYLAYSQWGDGVTWSAALRGSLAIWYAWGLLAWLVFWLARRFPLDGQRRHRNLVIHMFAAFDVSLVHSMLCASWYWAIDAPERTSVAWLSALRFQLLMYVHWDVLIYAAIVGIEHAFRYYQRMRDHERQALQLESQLSRARLDTLRMQLNPHFLFNSLNAISELIHDDPAAADRMITRLGHLLRRVLDEPERFEVCLAQELEFAEEYLEIERIRFADRLAVRVEVDPELLQHRVPILILQPLIENAIRHGVATDEKTGTIEIKVAREAAMLQIQIWNSGNGSATDECKVAGHGLSIVRARLLAQYGRGDLLQVERLSDGGFRARVRIPIDPANLSAPQSNRPNENR